MSETKDILRSVMEVFQKLERLEARIKQLETRNKTQDPTSNFDSTKLPRGKYAGKEHAWVVRSDPGYVNWLETSGIGAAKFGFTEQDIAACQAFEHDLSQDTRPFD